MCALINLDLLADIKYLEAESDMICKLSRAGEDIKYLEASWMSKLSISLMWHDMQVVSMECGPNMSFPIQCKKVILSKIS